MFFNRSMPAANAEGYGGIRKGYAIRDVLDDHAHHRPRAYAVGVLRNVEKKTRSAFSSSTAAFFFRFSSSIESRAALSFSASARRSSAAAMIACFCNWNTTWFFLNFGARRRRTPGKAVPPPRAV